MLMANPVNAQPAHQIGSGGIAFIGPTAPANAARIGKQQGAAAAITTARKDPMLPKGAQLSVCLGWSFSVFRSPRLLNNAV